MASKRDNWAWIKTAYVVKGYTAKRCAEEFGVDITTIKKRASKESWTQDRAKNATQGGDAVAQRMREVVDEEIARNAEAAAATVEQQMDTLALGARLGNKLAIAAEMMIDRYLNAEENHGKAASQVVFGISPGDKQSQADVLNALADAARKAIMVGREIGGLEKGKPSVVTGKDANAPRRFTFTVAPKPAEEPIIESVAS